MKEFLQRLVPRREQHLGDPRSLRLRDITVPLTLSLPQTSSATSPWEWNLAGLLMNRSLPHLPTPTNGGPLNKAGCMAMTMAGPPTWIPARSTSRYFTQIPEGVPSVGVLVGKGGGSAGVDRGHEEYKHRILESSIPTSVQTHTCTRHKQTQPGTVRTAGMR